MICKKRIADRSKDLKDLIYKTLVYGLYRVPPKYHAQIIVLNDCNFNYLTVVEILTKNNFGFLVIKQTKATKVNQSLPLYQSNQQNQRNQNNQLTNKTKGKL